MPASKHQMTVNILPLGDDVEEAEYKDINYVSLVNFETYGVPALLTEDYIEGKIPFKILYVNPQNIAAMEILRHA